MKKHFLLICAICLSITISTFSQKEKEKNIEKPQKTFNFNEPFHTLGFSVFTGISFNPKLNDHIGNIKPIFLPVLVPEFILQYNYMIKNGFGIALEVPFGQFRRSSLVLLSDYGAHNDVFLEMGSLYIGFTGKITVFKELHKNICMQGELGIKFNPFYHPADQWENKDYDVFNTHGYGILKDNSSINFPKVEQKYYGVPDATAAVVFFFHSAKKPRQNFVLGLNANISFVKRIKVNYDTRYSELSFLPENQNYGIGNYGWDSSSIGITLGYRFFGVK